MGGHHLRFVFRFMHMVTATFLTTSFVVAGIGAWYLPACTTCGKAAGEVVYH